MKAKIVSLDDLSKRLCVNAEKKELQTVALLLPECTGAEKTQGRALGFLRRISGSLTM